MHTKCPTFLLDVRLVEKLGHLPPVENNENNRGQKYPLLGVTGFNQVVIKLQLILNITFCDYDEEKEKEKEKNIRPRFHQLQLNKALQR